MVKGDVSVYQDVAGVEHVALVTEVNSDGTVDLAVLHPSQRSIQRSSTAAPGKFFDPSFVEEVAAPTEAPPNPGLQSVPQDSDVEQPEEAPVEPTRQFIEKEDGTLHEVLPEPSAHGSPADETPPESA